MKFLFGDSWSNVEVLAAMLIVASSLGFWTSLLLFGLVVIVNTVVQSATGLDRS